jgi:hypothetical protein
LLTSTAGVSIPRGREIMVISGVACGLKNHLLAV